MIFNGSNSNCEMMVMLWRIVLIIHEIITSIIGSCEEKIQKMIGDWWIHDCTIQKQTFSCIRRTSIFRCNEYYCNISFKKGEGKEVLGIECNKCAVDKDESILQEKIIMKMEELITGFCLMLSLIDSGTRNNPSTRTLETGIWILSISSTFHFFIGNNVVIPFWPILCNIFHCRPQYPT